MTDFRSELAWLVEDYVDLSELVDNDRGFAGSRERAEAEQNRAKAILAMTDWQPIETAPKDGRFFLIWPRDSEHATAHWERDCFRVDCCGQRADDLTHWMPIPDPPKD